jgi:quercetin dioxygenase-like cupin family protein
MIYIKNIEHAKALKLADEVAAAPGQVVSKTLAQNDAVSITLFAFSKGEEIGTHCSEGDAMVLVLEGCGELTVGGVKHLCRAGGRRRRRSLRHGERFAHGGDQAVCAEEERSAAAT